MNTYTEYCTEKQTSKAFLLGAPIEYYGTLVDTDNVMKLNGAVYKIPTTQQMIRWLEVEKNFGFSRNVGKYLIRYSVVRFGDEEEGLDTDIITTTCSTEREAIDVALDYLEKEDED